MMRAFSLLWLMRELLLASGLCVCRERERAAREKKRTRQVVERGAVASAPGWPVQNTKKEERRKSKVFVVENGGD